MRVLLVPEARIELHEAVEWYARRAPEVAQRFLLEYRAVRGRVAEAPTRWPVLEDEVRRIVFHKFPYSLLYAIEGEQVVVLAVKHDRRHPDYWKRRRH